MPVGVDSSGKTVPGEVPKLFGGNVVDYLKATGSEIPLIVASCIRAIDKEGERECVMKRECVWYRERKCVGGCRASFMPNMDLLCSFLEH